MELGVFTFLSFGILSLLNLTSALRGPNVCTQVQSVLHIDQIPAGGTMTQKIRYTTRCGLIGTCSRYRIVYVPGYRENTKLTYRVVKVCCAGYQAQKKTCVKAPLPSTPKDPDVTTNNATTSGNTGIAPGGVPGIDNNRGGGNPAGDGGISGKPGTDAGKHIDVTTKNKNFQGSYPNGPGYRGGSGPWVGLGPGPGHQPGTGRGTQRNGVGSHQNPRYQGPMPPVHRDKDGGSDGDGVYPRIVDGPEVNPDYKPQNNDPVMAFVSSATAAIGVLTLASTILGIYLLHRRQQGQGRGGLNLFSSFKFPSLGSGKPIETKVEMQNLTNVKSSSERDNGSGKKGKSRADCPYVDIEQMRSTGVAEENEEDVKTATPNNGNTSENNSKSKSMLAYMSRRFSGNLKRSLPRKPPTYAVVRKPKVNQDQESDDNGNMMTVASMCGGSASLTASMESSFTARASAHIYAQINRKSKGVSSSWSRSSSLPSRPTTLVSNPDLQTSGSYRALESFTRSLGRVTHKLDVRRSGFESSGYSSLQESNETLLYDTCSRRDRNAVGTHVGGVAPAALYRSLQEKGLFEKAEYDKLSRCVKNTNMPQENANSLTRGYATLTSAMETG